LKTNLSNESFVVRTAFSLKKINIITSREGEIFCEGSYRTTRLTRNREGSR
jgi:hypothetical protein